MIADDLPAVALAPEDLVERFHVDYVHANGYEASTRYRDIALNLDVDRLSYRIAKTNLRPMLDFVAGVRQDEVPTSTNISEKVRTETQYVGLVVRWNIWDGFANRGRVRAARTALRLRENQLAETRRDLLEQAQQAREDLDLAERTLRIAESRYPGARDAPKVMQAELERGRATQDQVDGAQAGANAARLGIVRVRADYLNAAANYLSLLNADPFVPPAPAANHASH
jgi:outer membrane protein TolC